MTKRNMRSFSPEPFLLPFPHSVVVKAPQYKMESVQRLSRRRPTATPDVINVVTLSRPFLHAPFPSLPPSHIIMKEGKHFLPLAPASFIPVSRSSRTRGGPLCPLPWQTMSLNQRGVCCQQLPAFPNCCLCQSCIRFAIPPSPAGRLITASPVVISLGICPTHPYPTPLLFSMFGLGLLWWFTTTWVSE